MRKKRQYQGREVPMSIALEKRLSLMAEASNLMLAGSAHTYNDRSKLRSRHASRAKSRVKVTADGSGR